MLIISAVSWWYTKGWVWRLQALRARLIKTVDYFSVDLLLRTLFMPFRQIGTDSPSRGLPDAMRAMADSLLSRMIGLAVRSLTILVGLIVMGVAALFSLLEIAVWLTVPLLPVAGALMFAVGWVPGATL